MPNLWWDYLHYHLPNYALSVVMYSLIGRFLLGFFLPPESQNYIWRWFRRLSDWFVRLVALVTPRFIAPVWLPLVAVFWIVALRLVFFMAMYALGQVPVAPRIGEGG